jgi:hypothetical protein
MHDTIYCSYDLGSGFWNKTLSTEDLQKLCLTYWLDPAGKFWEIDYTDTQDFCRDDPRGYVKNGLHGKVRPCILTKVIEVSPLKWDVKYAPFPRLSLQISNGYLTSIDTL